MGEKGIKRLTWAGLRGMRRHHQTLPPFGVRTFIWSHPRGEILVKWDQWRGYWCRSFRPAGMPFNDSSRDILYGSLVVPMPKRSGPAAPLVPPDLPAATKVLGKCPLLVQFLTCRSWEDGTARVPGRFWFDAGALGFSITLKDPNAALQAVLRASCIDDVFALCEAFLGSESAPWEVDQYQAERMAEKNKKKK